MHQERNRVPQVVETEVCDAGHIEDGLEVLSTPCLGPRVRLSSAEKSGPTNDDSIPPQFGKRAFHAMYVLLGDAQ